MIYRYTIPQVILITWLRILVFIVCHDGVMSDSNSLTVRYRVRSYHLNSLRRCNDMDSTIMLDYREIGMDTTGLVGGWINLAVIPAQSNGFFSVLSTDTISFSISEEHVQFRFLQLVHDRGGCNC